MTAEQQAQFNAANASFGAGDYTDALSKLKPLHAARPADAIIAKFTAEAALNTGDPGYAITALEPLERATPGDWQARSILAHAYAQAHRGAERDAELAKLVAMHKDTTDAKFRDQTQIIMESVSLAKGGKLEIYYSLVPWSRYNIYEMARVYGADGKPTQRITLESGDFDQPMWAEKHKKEAAAGMRLFSLDGYVEQYAPNGQHTQNHYTYGFLDGQPSYDTARDRFVAIAEGKNTASSSTTGIQVKP